jgi:hypothetical protein
MRPILTAIAFLGFASRGFAQEAGNSATPRKLAITGFAKVSYAYTSRGDADAIVGRLYDRLHDEFVLNALTLTLDMPHDAATLSAGFHAEVVYGQNATVIKSAGFDLGEQADAPQLFVTLNVPTGDGEGGVQIKLGRVPTLMGLEVIETPSNRTGRRAISSSTSRTSPTPASASSTSSATGSTRSSGCSTAGTW